MGNRAVSKELIELGNRIRERRQQIRLSQETLAERSGISANTVSRIEGGQMAMSVEIFQKLTLALDTDANSLLGLNDIAADDNGFLWDTLGRVRFLEQGEQEIVVHTMNALMNELEKNR